MINIDKKISKVKWLSENGYDLRSIEYIGEAFRIFKVSPCLFMFVGLLEMGIVFGLNHFGPKYFGNLIGTWLTVPLQIGYFIVARKIKYGQPYSFSNFFDAYSRFGPIFIMHIISLLIIMAGFICLIIPGIYLSIAYALSTCFIWFLYDGQIFESLERSRKLISREWFSFLGFMLLNGLVIIAGLMFIGVGVLIALPVTRIAIYVCFEDLVGTEEENNYEPALESDQPSAE